MNIRTVFALLVIALIGAAGSARAEEKAAPATSPRFEALKKLAGDWVEVDKDGKPMDKVVSSFRVTSAGSALQETIFPGTDHEMLTIYHMDGADLVLTHYCVLGNQPRLRAEPGKELNRFVFKFVSSTNLPSPNDHHMDHATFTIEGPDRFKAEWESCQDGKPCHHVAMVLARKQK
jgi:hypothetical protein